MKEIPLTQGKFALVDDDDFESLNGFKWMATKKGNSFYVRRNSNRESYKRTTLLMHRIILKPDDDLSVDHIDGNGLNNQKSNLRIVTHRINCQNRHHKKSSKYVGVCYCKRDKHWQSSISINGRTKYLGCFKDELKAHDAYMKALKELNLG